MHGGRWNPPALFGALYVNCTIAVAAANARRNFENEIATLYDLRPEQRPDLLIVRVATASFVDAVTTDGLRALDLPDSYPIGVSWDETHLLGFMAYQQGAPGIACRSNADATPRSYIGEELAVFDNAVSSLVAAVVRVPFGSWYPTEAGTERLKQLIANALARVKRTLGRKAER